ncbi:MAG TPA: c-type cytochrome [Vicinamibacterales bacterium]|nr:c-type cytochrome [Vicinamibacterales bacterium]
MGTLYSLPAHRPDAVPNDRFFRYRVLMVKVGLLVALCGAASIATAAPDPATTFVRNCSSCHTFGHGVLVGPDLKGATDRHDRQWLAAWIASSERLIQSGDATARALFAKFKRQRMPDQRLSPGEIGALLDYLAAGGPARSAEVADRAAETASRDEIEMGSDLFAGRRTFAKGGAPCTSCHRVGATDAAGGTLGPDLSRSFGRYRDKGMSALLARGCFPRVPTILGHALTDQEAFALRAFLRQAAVDRR